MTSTKIPDRRRLSWLSRWFAGGNHHTGELAHHAHHVLDRIADENARAFAERAKAEVAVRLRAEDTDILPRFGTIPEAVSE